MVQKSEDLRVRRTRKQLQQALVELAGEKGFANVTVRDIAERAMVNRSTFYRHYLDKYDLLRQYLEELYARIDSHVGDAPSIEKPDQLPEELPAGLVNILKLVQENAGFFRVMLGDKGDPGFCAQSIRLLIEKQIRQYLPDQAAQADPSQPPVELSVSYLIHAGIGAILWWLENDQEATPEQVALWLYQLSRANVNASLGANDSSAP